MMNYLNNSAGSAVTSDTGLQLNNVEVLYTKVQRVYMKPQFKEERQRELRVNVEIHAGISPVCRKVTYFIIFALTYALLIYYRYTLLIHIFLQLYYLSFSIHIFSLFVNIHKKT